MVDILSELKDFANVTQRKGLCRRNDPNTDSLVHGGEETTRPVGDSLILQVGSTGELYALGQITVTSNWLIASECGTSILDDDGFGLRKAQQRSGGARTECCLHSDPTNLS